MNNLFKKITKKKISAYREHLESLDLSQSTIKRRLSTLRKFCNWAGKEGYLKENPFAPAPSIQDRRIKPILDRKFKLLSNAYEIYHSISITSYLHYAVLVIFCVALGMGLYNQLTGPKAGPAGAYPTALTPPNRYLSFQGRLTDSSNNPITIPTNFVFKLWDQLSGGTEGTCTDQAGEDCLWSSGTCSITPDQDGIFSTILGSTCGTEIPSTVFTENTGIWLAVTVGSETLTPRIQVATVAYALNAETLQGYPPGTATSNIPYINSDGDVVIAAASPVLQSTSGTFAIEGKTGLVLQTASASNANITLAPNGTGALNINLGGASGNQMRVTDANITSGSLVSVYAGTNATGFDLLNLSSGSSETNRFSVDESGNTYVSGNLGIGTTNPGATLDVNGNVKIGTVNSVSDNNQVLTTDSGIVKYINTSGWDKTASDDVAGSGTTNYIPKWQNSNTLTDSIIYETGSNVGIGTTNPDEKLEVSGDLQISGVIQVGGASSGLAYHQFGTGTKDEAVIADAQDVYVSGDLEVDGTIYGNVSGTIDPDFTPGSVIFTGSGGELTQDNANFFWDDTNNRLGIGTTGPNDKLEVYGGNIQLRTHGYAGTSENLRFFARNNNDAWIEYGKIETNVEDTVAGSEDSSLRFYTNLNQQLGEKVRITSSGNVGIGTTNPSNELEVSGDIELTNLYDNDASNFFDGGCSATTSITGIDSTGAISCTAITGVPASSIAFSGITSGTNTQAAMVVGTGASLTYHDGVATSGEINASLLQNANWAAPLAIGGTTPAAGNFTSIGVTTQGTGAFTTLTSSGNTTLGTGASSVNVIGSSTTPGTLTLHGATTLDNTFTVSGSNLTSLGGNLTVTGTAWTATPTISGVVTMTSGFDSNAASTVTSLTIDGAAGAGDLTINSGETSFTSPATTADANVIVANSLTSGGALDISSTATAFTGSLIDVTLSGSNANNTGSLLTLTNSGTLNTGTTLYLKHYATGTNNLAMRIDDISGDTTPFVIDGGGNVGIGTTGPAVKLDVDGDFDIGASDGKIRIYDDANYWLLQNLGDFYFEPQSAEGDVLFRDYGNTVTMQLDNSANSVYIPSGNVGIGTTGPTQTLEVNGVALIGTPNVSETLLGMSVNTAGHEGISLYHDGSAGYLTSVDAGTSWHDIYYQAANHRFQISGSDKVIIDNAGNVGIGTPGPGYTLDVSGDIRATGKVIADELEKGDSTVLTIDAGSNVLSITSSHADLDISSPNGENLILAGSIAGATGEGTRIKYYNSAASAWQTALQIDNKAGAGDLLLMQTSGNVGIGTTNPGTYNLNVAGTTMHQNAVYFANGTTYYVDASGNAKFLDLIAADTGNPGLTVGDGTTGYLKVGGSTISDAAGDLTLDSDSGNITISDANIVLDDGSSTSYYIKTRSTTSPTNTTLYINNPGTGNANLNIEGDLTVTGNDILDAGGSSAITFDGSQNTALAGNLTMQDDKWIGLSSSAGRIEFDNQTTDEVNILDANVGIGTTGPATILDVSTTGHTQVNFTSTGANNVSQLRLIGRTGSVDKSWYISSRGGWDIPNNRLAFYDTGTVERVTFADGGNVGIGTTGPVARLHALYPGSDISGIRPSGTWAGMIENAYDSSGYNGLMVANRWGTSASTIFEVASYWNGSSQAYTPVLTVKGDRNVGIGTTAPARGLHVAGTTRLATSVATTDNAYFCTDATGDVERKTSACTVSALRYKENINDLTYGLDEINLLNPVFYNYKNFDEENPGGRTKRRIGLIAEEIAPIIPEVVLWNEEGLVDSIDYPYLAPLLIKGIQELDTRMKALEADVYLTDSGDLSIAETQNSKLKTQNYSLKRKTGEIIERIGAFSEAAIANLKAGLIQTQELKTDLISPLSEGGDVTIKLSDLPDVASESGETKVSKFRIINEQEVEVASIDSAGNATFAGELHAKKIVAEEIVGLKGKFGELLASTSSATYITQNITNITQVIEATPLPTPSPTPSISPEPSATESGEIDALADIKLSPDIEALVNQILNTSSEATPQAELAGNVNITNNQLLTTSTATFEGSLTVLGSTSLADTTIAGSLNVGGTMMLADSSINSLTGPLYLQNLGLGGVDILAGKVVIDEKGNVVFEGDVTIKGRLALSEIEPLPEEDIIVNLVNQVNQDNQESKFGKLLIKGVDEEVVASIDAEGTATFKKLAIASDQETVISDQRTEIETNATAGEAMLPANNTEITIKSQFVTDKTLVYITPISDTKNKVLFVKSKKSTGKDTSEVAGTDSSDGGVGWFKVGIDTPIETDIRFNWWIIN